LEGRSFIRVFDIKRYIKLCVKMTCKRVSHFIVTPMENLDNII
jgi:hypothetical protein